MRRFFQTHRLWFLRGALILWTLLIWAFSLQSGEDSGAMSGSLKLFLQNLLTSMGFQATVSEFLIRKAAHFCEYAVLGVLSGLAWGTACKTTPVRILWALPYPPAVALIDELLMQRLAAGRHPSLVDVGIDSVGATLGIALLFLIFLLLQRKFKK